MRTHSVSSSPVSIDLIEKIISGEILLDISQESRIRILQCRDYLDNKIRMSGDLVYGVNTGFGALHNVAVGSRELEQLQKNLVMSHACGMGPVVPKDIVRLMLF